MQRKDHAMAPDKIMHLIVGIFLGLLAGFYRLIGLFLAWAIVVGWEVWQAATGSGTPEIADIIYGGLGVTAAWLLVRYIRRKKLK